MLFDRLIDVVVEKFRLVSSDFIVVESEITAAGSDGDEIASGEAEKIGAEQGRAGGGLGSPYLGAYRWLSSSSKGAI